MAECSKKRTNSRGSIAMSSSSAAEELLPDELAVEILSRLGTLNEAARCSSLVCRRWRNIWRLVEGGVLDFDKRGRGYNGCEEAQKRFARQVDQALRSHCSSTLDVLRIGFDLSREQEKNVPSWIEFGLTKRVKELILASCHSHLSICEGHRVSVHYLTPEFLSKHDLSRLEVLVLKGVKQISQATVDHIFSSNYCPSLRRFSLLDSLPRDKKLVIRACSSSNLRSLDLEVNSFYDAQIELVSAPSLQTFKFGGNYCTHVKFVGELPQLRELWFGGLWHRRPSNNLRWYFFQFSKFTPQLECLSLELGWFHFAKPILARPPEWMVFEKLRVLDLSIHLNATPRSFLACTILLRAAPMLQELSIWFPEASKSRGWERQDLRALSTWKHHSLKVLQLHGVHCSRLFDGDVGKAQLELATYIIMNAPCLNQVLIDTLRQPSTRYRAAERRLPHQVDKDIYQAKLELETQLQGCSFSPQVNFTYR